MADAYYEPGVFTTFTAFEFSGVHRATGGWLHRNVFFRGPDIPPWGGGGRHAAAFAGTALGVDGRGVHRRLRREIAIPHNTNYGRGVVLAPNNADGTPFTAEILERRARAASR